MLSKRIEKLPLGYSEVLYKNKKYGLTKSEFNKGNSIKIYAEELGGNDFISLNYYKTTTTNLLKPCEMPEQKVVHFLNNLKLV